MSLFTIIKLSSYIYISTSILLPVETIDLTAQFLSLVFSQSLDSSNILPHVVRCFVLLVEFVVLYTILGGNAIYSLITKKRRNNELTAARINEARKETSIPAVNNKPADNVKILHSVADSELKIKNLGESSETSTVIPINTNNITSDIVVESAIIENDNTSFIQNDSPSLNNNIVDRKIEKIDPIVHSVKDTQPLIEPLNVINNDTNQPNLDDEIKSTSLPKNNNSDGMTEERLSVGKNILAQDQLIKNNFISNTTNHVMSTDSTSIEKDQEKSKPEKKTEPAIPSCNKSNHLDEDEYISTTTTSTTVTPPAEPMLSVDSKEEFYNNIIKKDSDIKSFSESVKNIFDGPPSTPLPNQKHDSIILPLSMETNTYHNENDDIKISNDKQLPPLQSSIEEIMSTATPALTPQAGSTSSRRSSTTSNNTSNAAKSKLQSALQKLSGPRQSTPQQQQKQQTIDSVVVNPSHSSTTISKNKSRFSSIRLTRKKSSGSFINQQSLPEEKQSHPEILDIEVKPSKSNKLNNKLKKTTKRFSKLFAPST